jgi:hypothetical protein
VRRNQRLFEAEDHTVARCNERISCPQRLKPDFAYGFIGMTEVVPFPNEVACFPGSSCGLFGRGRFFRLLFNPGLISAPQFAASAENLPAFPFPLWKTGGNAVKRLR